MVFCWCRSVDLNKLTPEDGFTVDNMHMISSRGSIPVDLEEPNLVPKPDDDSDIFTTYLYLLTETLLMLYIPNLPINQMTMD
jgi:hypothetical protein